MKTKISPAVVGMFVLGAMLLGLFALFSFGGVNFFSRPQRFVVYFDETIHGLDLGSPVKIRGVRVGRVVDIHLRYRAEANESVVAVVCELSRNVIGDEQGALIDVSDRARLQALVDRGLRAQLGVIGLATGLLYVELDFAGPDGIPPAPARAAGDERYVLVPAVPSTISEFQASLTEILTDLKRIDFAGLARELQGLLADTRRQVNALEIKGLVAQWTEAGAAVQAFVTGPELKGAVANLDGAITDLRAVLAKLDGRIGPASEDFNRTLAEVRLALDSFNTTARTLRSFINAQQGLGEGASQAFARLAEAAESVQRLADFLERNPGALLSGRKPPP